MNHKDFAKWISKIYATEENEADYEEVQSLLPAYVEAEFKGEPFDPELASKIETHLCQCSDSMETYQALRYLVKMEAKEELDFIEELDQPEEEAVSVPSPQPQNSELTPIAGS